jgi:hypothetical protein
LRSTAASHDTIDDLTTSYVPSVNDAASFQDKQCFMYNVFTNIIHTTKGKNCVHEASTTFDAQKVYASLLDVYHDHLSTKFSATKHCREHTLMKLDLHYWTAKFRI